MRNYMVELDGKAIAVYEATVSAIPFNQVWPGRQRSKDQTETAYFVTVDIEEESELNITVNEPFHDYEIRPLAYQIPGKRNGNTVTLTISKPMQFTFEADGYHHVLHIFVNAKSEKPSGDILYYGKGEHHAGLIWLESHQTMYLEEGAVVHGAVFAKDACDIKIMGRGILDSSLYRRPNDYHEGGREIFEQLQTKGLDKEYLAKPSEATFSSITMYHCKDVQIEGITVRDSMGWSVIVRNHCEGVVIDNIKIVGQWRYNADGIDICASKNVIVRNCFIRSFDDCFVARGAVLYGETEDVANVLVENCVMWCDWGKSLEVWCGEVPCAIRNVTFKNIYLIRLSNIAISITTWYGSSGTVIENLSYENILIDGDPEYRRLEIESPEHPVYTGQSDFVPYVLKVNAAHVGIPCGDQAFAEIEDTSIFNLVYRNISLDNVRYSGKPLRVQVQEQENMLKIQNVSVTNSDFELYGKTEGKLCL